MEKCVAKLRSYEASHIEEKIQPNEIWGWELLLRETGESGKVPWMSRILELGLEHRYDIVRWS